MPKSVECEVRTIEGWTVIGIEEYLKLGHKGGRCEECKKPVRAHKRSVNGMAAHFEHWERNRSCSRSDHRS